MKRISFWLAVVAMLATLNASAQDVAALEERIKQLNGYVQDLLEDKANQKKQIENLAREVQALRDQQPSQPKGNYATQDDLRALAKQVQEVEDNRKNDREVILKEIERLAKIPAKAPTVKSNPGSTRNLPDKAAEHTIAAGDTLSTIAAAYSKELNAKITTDLILKANPGLDPLKLKVDQKILVPIPEK